MFNPVTSKVTLTRDVRFLGKYYGELKNLSNDDAEPEIEEIESEDDDAAKKVTFAPEIENVTLPETQRNVDVTEVELTN